MKFGLATSGTTNPVVLQKIAVKADELGYDCLLVTDHYMNSRGAGTLDAWTFLSFVAAKTSKIRLGTCVTPIPFRQPAVLAKMISCLDQLSQGRVILGAGTGWYKPEFDGFSRWLESAQRVKATREGVELMLKLWTEQGPLDYSGRFVSSKGAVLDPKPVQKPHPPLWFGADGKRMLQMCGRYGDGWLPVGPRWFGNTYPRPEEYAEKRKVILAELAKRKINPNDFTFSIIIDYADTKTLRDEVERYASSGMNYFTLGLSSQRDESALEKIEQVAKEVGRSL